MREEVARARRLQLAVVALLAPVALVAPLGPLASLHHKGGSKELNTHTFRAKWTMAFQGTFTITRAALLAT